MAADVGDPLHMAWAMAWVGHQVVRDPLALFHANNFHPYPNSLAFGDHLLPEGLLGLPVNLLTGNAVLALNLVTAFALFTSALTACLVVSKLLEHRGAGLFAGVVVAFNGFTQGELLRVNVLHLQGWFLALLVLWRFTERPGWGRGLLFSLALGLQGLTGTYYAIYSAPLAPGILAAAYAARRSFPKVGEWFRLTLPALVVGAIGWLFLSPYRSIAAQSLAQKPIADGADLASFLLPGRDFWLLGGILPFAPKGESNHFLGYVPLLFALAGFVTLLREGRTLAASRRFVGFSAIWIMGLGVFISMGAYPRFMGAPLGESPYLLALQWVPTLRGMATVERAGVLVHIGLALIAALGVERIFRNRPSTALALALAGLAAAEQWTRPGPGFRVPAGSELPSVYRYLASGQGPVVEAPVFPDRLLRFRALYPYFSTIHWRPVPIGRASFYPPAHDYFATLMQGFPDAVSVEAMRAMGIRDVLVHPRMWSSRRNARLRALEGPDFELLRVFPEEVSPAAAALEMGDERVYRLRSAEPAGHPCVPADALDQRSVSTVSNANEGLSRLRDNDLATSWSTVHPQKEGDFIEMAWPEPRAIAAIRMALGSRRSDFPTAPRVEILGESGAWEPSSEIQPLMSVGETLEQLMASDPAAAVTLRFHPVVTRGVRVVLGRDPDRPGWNPWSVAEFQTFARCDPAR